MSVRHVLVIGGGAAGMTAAIRAAERGASVTLLERFQKLGRKLLATGNGRCNLCNAGAPVYFGETDFALSVLQTLPPARVLGALQTWGIQTVQEDDGRVYPACGQAAAVLDVLRARLLEYHVQVVLDARVVDLRAQEQGFVARTEDSMEYAADACILATGGCAGGNLGCDLSTYSLATNQGHSLVPLAPALAPLTTERAAVRGLAGLRVPTIVTLMDGQTPVSAAQGEALFADYGVSGICVMQLARDAYAVTLRGGRPWLKIDFSPMLGVCKRAYGRIPLNQLEDHAPLIQALLEKRARTVPQNELLLGLLPSSLIQKLGNVPLETLPALLSAYPIAIQGVRTFDNAQVTQGGISTERIDPTTMQSFARKGLYITGEMLDVDGDCGGYNLLFAFATGLLAGENAATGG